MWELTSKLTILPEVSEAREPLMETPDKVIRIEVEWADGRLERAVGEDAAKIWSAIEGGFGMNQIHGMPYAGPRLKVIREPKP